MKKKLMSIMFVGAMFVSASVFAAESDASVVEATPSTGWLSSASSAVSKVISTPSDLHTAYPKVTGLTLLAVVAVIAYKMGAAEAETRHAEDLL